MDVFRSSLDPICVLTSFDLGHEQFDVGSQSFTGEGQILKCAVSCMRSNSIDYAMVIAFEQERMSTEFN